MKHSLRHGGGFLEIDHRESPGITPADVAGLPDAIVVGNGQHFETDSYLCTHCQRQVLLVAGPGKIAERGYCAKCDHYICNGCKKAYDASGGQCVPFKAVLDRAVELAQKFAGQPDHPDAAADPVDLAKKDAEAPRVVLTDPW